MNPYMIRINVQLSTLAGGFDLNVFCKIQGWGREWKGRAVIAVSNLNLRRPLTHDSPYRTHILMRNWKQQVRGVVG